VKTAHLAALLGLLLCACSGGGTVSVANRGGGSAVPATASGASSPVSGNGGIGAPSYAAAYLNLQRDRGVFIQCDGQSSGQGAAASAIHDLLVHTGTSLNDPGQQARAVAIATVIGTGSARWNTSDGAPPSQAYLDSLKHPVKVDGHWPVDPSIYTPWTIHVSRVVRGEIQTTQITGYTQGGTVGGFTVHACPPTAQPVIGGTFLVWFGGELTTGAMGDAPIAQPLIGDWLSYDPSTDTLKTANGPVVLRDALAGVPPG